VILSYSRSHSLERSERTMSLIAVDSGVRISWRGSGTRSSLRVGDVAYKAVALDMRGLCMAGKALRGDWPKPIVVVRCQGGLEMKMTAVPCPEELEPDGRLVGAAKRLACSPVTFKGCYPGAIMPVFTACNLYDLNGSASEITDEDNTAGFYRVEEPVLVVVRRENEIAESQPCFVGYFSLRDWSVE
jgi:hypothetical protein